MKVLYIGHYKENSGWSKAAINNILALDSVGIDVVCRDVKLTSNQYNLPSKISELEKKNLENVDVCIQHVLPHHLCYTSKFKKNIAYFVHESNTIKNNDWYSYLAMMQEIWVPTQDAKNRLIKDGIDESTLKVIPHSFDVFQYQSEYKKFDFKEYNDYFKFYTIADINDRKNIGSIIRSYYSEFSSDDRVCLVLKIKKHGMSKNQLNESMQNAIDKIKQDMRMYKDVKKYPMDVVIADDFDEQHIMSLHSSCDCFVGISHGEGWSIPAFEAMCFGNTPICSNEGGPKDFIDEGDLSTGCLIDGIYNVCTHSDPAFPFIFTGHEEWFVASEAETKKAMRYYYENRESVDKIAGIKRAREFTFENIGNKMKELLND